MFKKIVIGLGVLVAVLVVAALALTRGNPGIPLNDIGATVDLEKISLPPGFRIALYSRAEGARSLTVAEDGTVFVGSRGAGRVYALRDDDGDGVAERVYVVAEGLHSPNGVAVLDGDLYVAEISRILRFDDAVSRLADPPTPVVLTDSLPDAEMHGWKFIAFGPDGLLYVPVGAPCNSCESEDERFGTIARMRPDGTGFEIYARGVRNTVGFDWHPDTGDLWFTDNGRDWLGDDAPPDELNQAPAAGLHFGFPYIHGVDIADPDIALPPDLGSTESPVVELGAHVAALGMRFYDGAQFPPEYVGRVFIAEHGSWNRTTPSGYRITTVDVGATSASSPAAGSPAPSYEVFASGWEEDRDAWGRPVDVLVMPDGSLLVSDDRAGAVYRISYGE